MEHRWDYQLKEEYIALLKWQKVVSSSDINLFQKRGGGGGRGCVVLVLQKRAVKMSWHLKNLLCGEKFFHPVLLGDMITKKKVSNLFMDLMKKQK